MTRDELLDLELRLVGQMSQMEIRLTQRINDLALTQLRYIQGLYVAIILSVAILVAAKVFA